MTDGARAAERRGSRTQGWSIVVVGLIVALALAGLASPAAGAQSKSEDPKAGPTATPDATATPAPTGPPAEDIATYHSRPDLRPPIIDVDATDAAGDDLLLVTPRYGGEGEGVMIVDASGDLVWLRRSPGRATVDLRPLRYRGAPALSWWEGVVERGLGDGEFVIVDETYREIARFSAVRYPADLHELLITPADTAYVFAMDQVSVDGQLIDDILIQEVDPETGRLLWQWRASDHIPLDESVEPLPDEGPWDYLHLNSIDLDPDGDLILSGRHTDTIYKVSRETGEVVWRLGGKDSDFRLPRKAVFRKQHDARWHPDGTLSLFDNATKDSKDDTQPRGLVLRLDEDDGTAKVVRELAPPRPTNSSSQGSFTIDESGRATIGWGSSNLVTGYDADDEVVFDVTMPGGFSSYRAYRSPWVGKPLDRPLLSIGRNADGEATVWVSWNGATEVASWELLAGGSEDDLSAVGESARDGFETALAVPDDVDMVAVRALDANGRELGMSDPVMVEEAMAEEAQAEPASVD